MPQFCETLVKRDSRQGISLSWSSDNFKGAKYLHSHSLPSATGSASASLNGNLVCLGPYAHLEFKERKNEKSVVKSKRGTGSPVPGQCSCTRSIVRRNFYNQLQRE